MAEYPLISFIGFVPDAFIYTWLYNSIKGSILIVSLFHISTNIFGEVVPGVSQIAVALLSFVVAIALITVFGSTNLSRQPRVCKE